MPKQGIIVSILFLIFLLLGLTNILTIIAEKIILSISPKLSNRQLIRREEWLASLEYIPSPYSKLYYSLSLIPVVFIKDQQILLKKALYSCIDLGEILFSISFEFLGSVIKPVTVVLNIICSFAILFIIIPSLLVNITAFDSNFIPLLFYCTFTIFFQSSSMIIRSYQELSTTLSTFISHYKISHHLHIFFNYFKRLIALDYQYQFFYFYILNIFISFILISIIVAEHI